MQLVSLLSGYIQTLLHLPDSEIPFPPIILAGIVEPKRLEEQEVMQKCLYEKIF